MVAITMSYYAHRAKIAARIEMDSHEQAQLPLDNSGETW